MGVKSPRYEGCNVGTPKVSSWSQRRSRFRSRGKGKKSSLDGNETLMKLQVMISIYLGVMLWKTLVHNGKSIDTGFTHYFTKGPKHDSSKVPLFFSVWCFFHQEVKAVQIWQTLGWVLQTRPWAFYSSFAKNTVHVIDPQKSSKTYS